MKGVGFLFLVLSGPQPAELGNCAMLGVKPRASYKQGNCSAAKPHAQLRVLFVLFDA